MCHGALVWSEIEQGKPTGSGQVFMIFATQPPHRPPKNDHR